MKEILTLSADKVKAAGFAKFNGGDHVCLDIPDGHTTISVRLSDGRQITFAFMPYREGGQAGCIDIKDHGGKPVSGKRIDPGATATEMILFAGGDNVFHSRAKGNNSEPVTMATLLLAAE